MDAQSLLVDIYHNVVISDSVKMEPFSNTSPHPTIGVMTNSSMIIKGKVFFGDSIGTIHIYTTSGTFLKSFSLDVKSPILALHYFQIPPSQRLSFEEMIAEEEEEEDNIHFSEAQTQNKISSVLPDANVKYIIATELGIYVFSSGWKRDSYCPFPSECLAVRFSRNSPHLLIYLANHTFYVASFNMKTLQISLTKWKFYQNSQTNLFFESQSIDIVDTQTQNNVDDSQAQSLNSLLIAYSIGPDLFIHQFDKPDDPSVTQSISHDITCLTLFKGFIYFGSSHSNIYRLHIHSGILSTFSSDLSFGTSFLFISPQFIIATGKTLLNIYEHSMKIRKSISTKFRLISSSSSSGSIISIAGKPQDDIEKANQLDAKDFIFHI